MASILVFPYFSSSSVELIGGEFVRRPISRLVCRCRTSANRRIAGTTLGWSNGIFLFLVVSESLPTRLSSGRVAALPSGLS